MSYVRPASAYSLATGTAGVQAVGAPADKNKGTLVFLGCSIRESAGTAAVATVIIRNGTDNTGAILAVIELAANASAPPLWFGDGGVIANDGIYVDRVAGETQGAIYYGFNV